MNTTEHSLSVPDLARNCNESRELTGLFLRKWSPLNRRHCTHQPRAPLPFFDSARDYWLVDRAENHIGARSLLVARTSLIDFQ